MMVVVAVKRVHVQGRTRTVRKALKELASQVDIEIPHPWAAEFCSEVQSRTTREVDDDAGQGFVERHVSVTVALDSSPLPQRLGKRRAESDPDILDTVMIVDMDVTLTGHIDIEQPVTGDLVEHVIEKRYATRTRALTRPVEHDGDGNGRFQGGSGDARTALGQGNFSINGGRQGYTLGTGKATGRAAWQPSVSLDRRNASER